MKQENKTEAFSHPPSAEELMEIYASSERNDPKSPYYERILVRPKISVLRILLCVAGTLLACAGGAITGWILTHKVLPTLLGLFGIFILICFIFAKRILITLVKIYQATAPESVRKRCRYEPSCSVYMILSVEKYGFWRGLRKGLKRWKSCKPPNGGFDMP